MLHSADFILVPIVYQEGKFAADGQNLIYLVQSEEDLQKPAKSVDFQKLLGIFLGCGHFRQIRGNKINVDHLPPTQAINTELQEQNWHFA